MQVVSGQKRHYFTLDVKLEKTIVVRYNLNGLPDEYRYLMVNLESQVTTISYEDLSAQSCAGDG